MAFLHRELRSSVFQLSLNIKMLIFNLVYVYIGQVIRKQDVNPLGFLLLI